MAAQDQASIAEESDAFAGRLLNAGLGMMEVLSVYLGDRLGLYAALSEGPTTSTELAQKLSMQERYLREWLEQQAVYGILDVEDAADPSARRYSIHPGRLDVLVNRDSLNYMAPVMRLMVSMTKPLPQLLEAYQNGGGVSWSAYGEDALLGQGDINRPVFFGPLVQEWMPSIAPVAARLAAMPPARIADIGCGVGWSCIAMAQAFPGVIVDGYDLDEASIEEAKRLVKGTGVEDRVNFFARDAADPGISERYDVVVGLEMLHDLSRPVEVLSTMRRLLAPGGSVLILDENVAEEFAAPGDEIERLMYGWSILCCLATGMLDQPSAATGTVMRPDTVRRYAAEAGFSDTEVIKVDHPFFRLYRLVP